MYIMHVSHFQITSNDQSKRTYCSGVENSTDGVSEERGDEEDFQNSFTVGLFSSSLTRISSEKTFKVNKP